MRAGRLPLRDPEDGERHAGADEHDRDDQGAAAHGHERADGSRQGARPPRDEQPDDGTAGDPEHPDHPDRRGGPAHGLARPG
ncbi:hypothetical protein AB4028_11490, partial [Janibacter sp. RAF20_2_2]